MEFWILTPYLGKAADQERTIGAGGMFELPRRAVFVGFLSALGFVPLALLFSWAHPVNWGVAALGIAACVWLFGSSDATMQGSQAQRLLALSRARGNKPIFAQSMAYTTLDDVRMLQQGWRRMPQRRLAADQLPGDVSDVFSLPATVPAMEPAARTQRPEVPSGAANLADFL